MSAKQPNAVRAAYISAIVVATLVGCCALYSGVTMAAVVVMGQQLGGLTTGPNDPAEAMFAMYRTLAVVTFVLMIFQLAVSGALAVGGSFGLSGRPTGRPLTLAALGAFAFLTCVEVGVGIWSWSMSSSFAQLNGAAVGGPQDPMAQLATGVSLIPSVCWAVFKLCVAAAAALTLLSTESRAYHAQLRGAEPALGPRG